MNAQTIQHSIEHDNLFQKYGGTLYNKREAEPKCGYRAIIKYAREINEPLPLSPERVTEIEAILLSKH